MDDPSRIHRERTQMKIVIIAIVALLLGVGGGAFVGGNRLKEEILQERAQVRADSLSAADGSHEADPHGEPGAAEPGAAVPGAAVPGPAAVALGDSVPVQDDGASGDAGAHAPTGASEHADGSEEAEQTPTQPESSAPAARTGASAAAAPDSASSQGAMQLARMFSAMQPADAAAVLQELSDAEVEAIMRHMQSRLAGQILSEFDAARAATLSRIVLRPEAGS